MLELLKSIMSNPEFFTILQQWLLAMTSVITAASAITALTPTKKDDKIRAFILKVLHFLALNIGNSKPADNEAEDA